MGNYQVRFGGGERGVLTRDATLPTQFFAQIFTPTDEEPEEGEATIWLGTEPGELPSPEIAIRVVEAYADIPETLAADLAADMSATVGVKDGLHQAAAKRRLFGSIN